MSDDEIADMVLNQLEAENAALRERLAAAEHDKAGWRVAAETFETMYSELQQREQQARHVLELVALAQPIDDSGTIISLPAITSDVFYEGPPKAGYVIDQARAWLADRAEQAAQRAAAQEEHADDEWTFSQW